MTEDNFNPVSALACQQHLLYQITRITWDEKKRKNVNDVCGAASKIVRGYVVDPLKNDVAVFHVDANELTPQATSQFLWDYVGGCGIRREWKKL